MKKISVIIPSYNSAQTIEHTLVALQNQSRPDLLAEIIIVDSSDDNQTKQILSRWESPANRVINSGAKVMPALSRNIGAAQATGEILAFIDSDAYPERGWIENILGTYVRGHSIGGGSVEMCIEQENKFIPLAQYFLQFNEFMPSNPETAKRFVPTVNMFCEKELFERIGGFPSIRASEDVLFGLRANSFSKVWFTPGIKIFHIFREDIKGFLKNQMLLGKYIIIYRRQEKNDAFYYKGLCQILFFPGFLMIKLFNITIRIFKAGPRLVIKYFRSLPFFLLGLLFWSIGFIQGAVAHNEAE